MDSKEKEWRADTSHELWNGELTDSGEEGVTVTSWDRECQVQGQGGHRAPGVPMVGPGICAGLARRVVRLVDEEQKLWGGTLTRAVFTRISKSCYREQQVDQAAALEVNASQQSLKPTKCQWAPTNWPQGEVVTVTFKLTSASSPHLGGYHLVLVVADATGFTLADPNLGVVQCAFSNVNGSLASLGLGAILRGLYAHRPGNPQLVEIDGLQTGTLDEFMN